MIINKNIPALVTNNALAKANISVDKSSKRLSTGKRINSAADDAAGLAISNKMLTQIKGLDMAERNGNDAVSLIQTAEGGLAEVDNMLQRMRELAIQGANDTLTTADRFKIQDEVDQLIDEISDTAKKIQFNTKNLLNGEYDAFTFQIGPNVGLTLDVKMEEITPYTIGKVIDENGTFMSLSELRSSPSTAIQIGLKETTKEGVWTFAEYDPTAGTGGNGQVAVKEFTVQSTTTPKPSDITRTGTYIYTGGKLYDTKGNDVTSEVGFEDPNTITNDAYADGDIIKVEYTVNDYGATEYKETISNTNNATVTGSPFDISTNTSDDPMYSISEDGSKMLITTPGDGLFTTVQGCAQTCISVLDGCIDDVSGMRSKLGAAQNRLEYTISSIQTANENAQSALSRVQDTDMANEMTNYTKNNVIVQAGISMLAQANQRPNQLLSLLQG